MSERWHPHVVAAAIVEQYGKFLLVEEHTAEGLRLNQPAGHWERGETLLDAHAAGHARVAIVRASDFYGPRVRLSQLGERVIGRLLNGKPAQGLGDPDQPHTFTYAPEFVRGLVTVAGADEAFGEIWHVPNAQTIADNGGGTPACGTIAATVGIVHVTCSDADGCALTLSETTATVGSTLRIINVATNNLTIADSAGVQETTGSLTLGANDNVMFCYVASYWTQCSPVVDVT